MCLGVFYIPQALTLCLAHSFSAWTQGRRPNKSKRQKKKQEKNRPQKLRAQRLGVLARSHNGSQTHNERQRYHSQPVQLDRHETAHANNHRSGAPLVPSQLIICAWTAQAGGLSNQEIRVPILGQPALGKKHNDIIVFSSTDVHDMHTVVMHPDTDRDPGGRGTRKDKNEPRFARTERAP